MASNRKGRINEELQRELSTLIRALKDPRVQQSMVSVTKVEATGDLRYAKVYISVLDKDKSKETLKGLKSAGGFLRREIGSRLQLRYTPELVFEEDDSIAYGAKMFDLLRSLDVKNEDSDHENDEACRYNTAPQPICHGHIGRNGTRTE